MKRLSKRVPKWRRSRALGLVIIHAKPVNVMTVFVNNSRILAS